MKTLYKQLKENPSLVAKLIDHTNVNPNATAKDIQKLCKEAKKYGFYSVVTIPYYVELARNLLKGSDIKVGVVIGFPFGVQNTDAKLVEMRKAYKHVEEFDVVMNRAAFKNKDYDFVLSELKQLVEYARKKKKVIKVIIETPELTNKEIAKATELVLKSGADFVKTAVGLKGPATLTHVRIMNRVVKGKIGIKVSGGVRTFDQVLEFVKNGATRIGSSHGVDIIKSIGGKARATKKKGYFHE